jgi:hypothetical protein
MQVKAKWTIPDGLVEFMVNLPRSIQAKRLHELPWLVKRVWRLFDLRLDADVEDTRLGYALQPFLEYTIEAHLERSALRTTAEMTIYMLITRYK